MTAHDAAIRTIHEAFPTTTERLLVSAGLLAAQVALAALVYSMGPTIESRVEEGAAEAVQSVVVTAFGVVVAVLLVVVWEQSGRVGEALRDVAFGPEAAVRVMVVLLVFAVAYTVTRVTKRLVWVSKGRDAISNHQREILHHVVQIAIFVPAVLFALRLFRVDAGNILLSAGAISLIVGLAARQTLGAVLAGFVVLFSRPFEVGDWVVVDEVEGTVTDVTVVNTRVRTFDDEIVMIPNDEVTAANIVNRSRSGRLRIQVDVGVDYDADVERAAEVALGAMDGLDEPLDHPEPDVVVERFGDSAVVLNLRFWIDNPSVERKWDAQNAVMSAVKRAFEREGIKIPFPQRELTGREERGGLRVDAAGATRAVADADDSAESEAPAGDGADSGADAGAGGDADAGAGADAGEAGEAGEVTRD